MRCVIYTINTIKSLNALLLKVAKNKAAFSDDASIIKIIYLAISKAAKKWNMLIKN